MATGNPAESDNISSFRRMPFIAAGEPRDVSDLPIEDEAPAQPPDAVRPEIGSPHFIGPPPPPQTVRARFASGWQWGLIGLGVIAVAGFGGLKLYQSRQTPAPAAVVGSPRPVLNSSTALSASRDAATRLSQAPAAGAAPAELGAAGSTRAPAPAPSEVALEAPAATITPTPAPSEASPQTPAAGPAPARLEAPASTRTVAPARFEAPPAGGQPQPAPDSAPRSAPSAAIPSRPPATEIMTEGRKIVASPMMGEEQRQVLDLMAATDSVVLQVKRQVDDVGKKVRDMQAQLDDMKQMVSLSNAKLLSGATQIAMGNLPPAPEAPLTGDRQAVAAALPDVGPACRLRPSYIVASASPAHATLKSGGQVFISVRAPSKDNPQGDSIPCFGHVLKITQQEGSRWVVMTERDVIGRN